MEHKPSSAGARIRQEEEDALRKRKTSLRFGGLGLVLLFASGVGIVIAPSYVFPLIAAMAGGIVLLLVAFLLIRTSTEDLLSDSRKR